MDDVTLLDILLWAVVPYVTMAFFVLGHIWRYRYDQFGWTTRSSQMYEDRILRWASPLFHFGILAVLVGHIVGLMVPSSWTEFFGISEHLYHFFAISVGSVAGICTVIGLVLLLYRRRTSRMIMGATTRMDKVMYLFLGAVIAMGLYATVAENIFGTYNYREGLSLWFRSIWFLHPDFAAMAAAPLGFQIHALIAMTLFALWPFTRLVHVFSVPVGYLTRPYIVYRSRDRERTPSRSGW